MQITGVVVLVVLSIILFELFPEKSAWSIPVRQADEHMIAVPTSGGSSLLLMRREAHTTRTKEQQQVWKRILIIDDDADIILTFKTRIEDYNNNTMLTKKIEVHTSSNPVVALSEFKPNFYDLLLIDINMPYIDGFQLSERILDIDIDVKICYMSAGEINRDALREIHPSISLGCFIKKPVEIDYLIGRVIAELD